MFPHAAALTPAQGNKLAALQKLAIRSFQMFKDMNPSINAFSEGLFEYWPSTHGGVKVWIHTFLTLVLAGLVHMLDE
jgi:hypothetical protein